MLHIFAKLSVFIIIFLSLACRDDGNDTILDDNGVVIKLRPIWKSAISDDGEFSETVIATSIIRDGSVLVGSRKNADRAILSLDASDGSVNWQWNDLLGLASMPSWKDPITLYEESYHTNGDLLFFTYTGSSYCLNLTTGNTVWKYKEDRHRYDRNAGFGDTYFTSGCNYEPIDDEKVYIGSLSSSEREQLLLTPEYTPVSNPPVNAQGRVTHITPFQENAIMYVAFGTENPYTDFSDSGWGLTELNLYNLTENKVQYSKVVVNPTRETRVISDLIYQERNLYFQSSNFIHGYEALTGKELWRTRIGSPPLLSSMILVDGRLFSANEDRFLYCLDSRTGEILWKEQNTGTCCELSYLNGVLYYLGGGDGLLHAVNADTGKHLWKISSPDLGRNSGAWFHGVCTAVPGKNGNKGVVVATTGLHAVAYKAIQ